ncbi:SirB1 family protein [Lacimicrobium alkaliphilum]|uniref:Protein SirB1 N-terminal domain-containing protein n=1 Tax=Lacimicrobium alkaliphilum TaxID=1526571 RepID=A0ABQ1RC23_9ALTE|nr:tetratricopeptide repeat protein [Lacimicrobium alkaliphilum]GGD63622.1 hypothetical protein GCM10011357_18660 [Lacimicrobium alkaliphilum]
MMTSIQLALDDDDLLTASLLVAQKFDADISLPFYISVIRQWEQRLRLKIDLRGPVKEQVRALNQFFFTELAFAGQPRSLLASDYALMDQVILYRNGCAVCLSILYCHLARAIGLDVKGVSFPGHFLNRVKVNEQQSLFFDALTGKQLSWNQLEQLYRQMSIEEPEMSVSDDVVRPASSRDVLMRLVQNLKAAFIDQDQFQQALIASELLVSLNPDDPYERRGRGWVLQQLNCYGGAYADYQYYIRQCPQDPAAHLLKLQLRSHSLKSEILH